VLAGVVGFWPSPAAHATVAGGGPKRSDCYVEFEGLTATRGRSTVQCRDGDSCDADGSADGSCTFQFQVCANESDPSLPTCTPRPLSRLVVRGKARAQIAMPDVSTGAATCGASSTVVVALKKRRKATTVVRVTGIAASGRPRRDVDRLVLRCQKSKGGGCATNCPANPDGGPREIDYVTADHGTDLDNGVSGASHNFPIIAGSSLKMCLSGCDGASDPQCDAVGCTSVAPDRTHTRPDQNAPSLNGVTLGPPLPLYASGAPVCVVNRFRDRTVRASVNVKTGEVDASATPIVLLSDVYSTDPTSLCPQCLGGRCNGGANAGGRCTVDGTVRTVVGNQPPKVYQLSRSCPPGGDDGSFDATLTISLPITTGTSRLSGSKPCPGQLLDDQCSAQGGSRKCDTPCDAGDPKGGLNQWCCGDGKTPCFPTSADSAEPDHAIVRAGHAVPPTPQADGTLVANDVATAAVFCEASTNTSVVDTVAGLPGPGAIIFNGTQTWLPSR
jgi:hypothetical protein